MIVDRTGQLRLRPTRREIADARLQDTYRAAAQVANASEGTQRLSGDAFLMVLVNALINRLLEAGDGLNGGGDLSANRSFSVGAGVGIEVDANSVGIADTGVMAATYGAAALVPRITINEQGQVTEAEDVAITAASVGALARSNNFSDLTDVPTARSNLGIPTLAYGTYSPTLTNVANLDSSLAYACQYLRVGSIVTVSGRVDVDATTAGVSTQLGIALPIASNFTAAGLNECAGSAGAPGVAGMSGAIIADATNDRAELRFIASDTTNRSMFFTFTYVIV